MILSSPRSGTHMLRTALRNHINVAARSELFNPDFIRDRPFGPETPAAEILDQYIFRDYPPHIQMVGFILHRSGTPFGNWPDLWPMLDADQDLYVISLRRRNLLRRYLSYQTMRNFRGRAPESLRFDPALLEQDFQYQEQEVAAFDQRFAKHPLIKIHYEDLCTNYNQTIGKVLEFLQAKPQQVWPDIQGKPQRRLSEAIINFADLKAHFATTKWASFFDEETNVIHVSRPEKKKTSTPPRSNSLLDQIFDSPPFKPYLHFRKRYQESWLGMTQILLKSFFSRHFHRTLSRKKEYYDNLPQNEWAFYSERIEELLIRSFFQDRRKGHFVDVGCAWPIKHSNTFYLERHLGWSGLAIDAAPSNTKDWEKHRPKSRLLNYIVGEESGKNQRFYRAGGLGSTQKERSFAGKIVRGKEVIVPTITLTQLLQDHGVKEMDFISIDVEQYELKVLAGFDIKRFQPKLVCIEVYHENREAVEAYFVEHNYTLLEDFRYWDKTNLYYRKKKA
ncbi:MAG: FkbM family methyltransferase [Bacteroidota bacterium]